VLGKSLSAEQERRDSWGAREREELEEEGLLDSAMERRLNAAVLGPVPAPVPALALPLVPELVPVLVPAFINGSFFPDESLWSRSRAGEWGELRRLHDGSWHDQSRTPVELHHVLGARLVVDSDLRCLLRQEPGLDD